MRVALADGGTWEPTVDTLTALIRTSLDNHDTRNRTATLITGHLGLAGSIGGDDLATNVWIIASVHLERDDTPEQIAAYVLNYADRQTGG